jgi:hypothetical protein
MLLLAVLALSQCASEPVFEAEMLWGRWELREGFRSGKLTESLDGLYFEFGKDGRMNTNLPAGPGEARYELEGSSIRQSGNPADLIYTIQELSDTVMVLSTDLRNVNFRFILQKGSAEQE